MKRRIVGYHLMFWACIYALWITVFRSYSFAITKTMTIQFCYLLFITADFYAINNFIVPQFLNRKKPTLFILFSVAAIVLSAWLRSLVAVQMNRHYFHDKPITDFAALYISSLINISVWVMLVTIGKMFIDKAQTGKQVEQLQQERIKNELAFLKAQINPHALFNSLNTVYGNIDKSNQLARNTLLQFSELLRYQLYECTADKVSLCKEMTYIENYIAFERLRKDEKLLMHVKLNPIDTTLIIAPLMLVVLLENAFKFVSDFSDQENKICISIHTEGTVLHSTIRNTKECTQAISSTKSNGIGIANLQRRLDLLYAGKYQFSVNKNDHFYETNLTIELA